MPARHVLPTTRSRVLRAATRVGWGIADQGVSSITNFALGIVVARALDPAGFGVFGLAWVTYGVVLNVSRGLCSDPFTVRFSTADPADRARAVTRMTGAVLAVGAVAGIVVAGLGATIGGPLGSAFVALGLVLPGVLLQDAWRFAFFAAGTGERSFVNDVAWAAALVPALAVAASTPSVFAFVLAWGVAGGLAGLLGSVQSGMVPRPSRVGEWLREHRDLGPRYLVENVSLSGAAQLRLFGLGAIAGLAAVGAIRGGELLIGPFLALLMGVSVIAVPEASRVRRAAPHRLLQFCLLLGSVQALAAAAWGGVLLLLPDGWGRALLGDVWPIAAVLIVPMTLTVMGSSLSSGAMTGLRTLGAARRSLRAQLVAATAYAVFGIAGAWLDGAPGSAWGLVLATSLAAAVWWSQLRAALRAPDASAQTPDRKDVMTPINAPRVGFFGLLGGGNIGNDGSMEAVLAHLLAQRPDAVVDCFCSGPEQITRRFGIPATPMQLWAGYRQTRSGPGASALKVLGKVVDAGRTLAWVRRHDVVIVPGAGVLEATLPLRPWGFPYALVLLCLSGRLVGTRVALLHVGADAIDSRATRWLVRSAARLAHHRSFRDMHSREAMRQMGVDTEADEVGPDLTFALPVPENATGPTGTVGVGLMAWSGANGDRRQATAIRGRYVATMTAFVGRLVDGGRRVRLFVGDDVDAAVVAQVRAAVRADRPYLVHLPVESEPIGSLEDLERQMRDVDVVVATRFHNIITALRLGKPTLSVSYSVKSDTVMAEMGLAEFCHPARNPDLERLTAQFAALEARSSELGRVVATRAGLAADLLDSQLTAVCRELLGGRPVRTPDDRPPDAPEQPSLVAGDQPGGTP